MYDTRRNADFIIDSLPFFDFFASILTTLCSSLCSYFHSYWPRICTMQWFALNSKQFLRKLSVNFSLNIRLLIEKLTKLLQFIYNWH